MKIAVAGATGQVGRQVVALAKAQGHEVVELTRSTGFDLLKPDGLTEALAGVEAVVEVTASPTNDGAARAFFTTVAENLGRAATAAGVTRTVVLSIVGTDLSPEYDYYVAKVAQEQAYRAHAPGAVIVRATQFHEFAGQMIEWFGDGSVVAAFDVPIQPVATAEVAKVLLSAALGEITGDVDLAGPKAERLADLIERLIQHRHLDLKVELMPAPESWTNGSMLPGPGALLRGPDFQTWLQQQ
ncbi:MAG TPA: NAD(P)H-binding protein [Sporichthyaceae bacterium]|nr:NAD(P)H-binding protein [Sporichthyaceae bacterium]